MDELLALYRSFDLPLPPKDADLVQLTYHGSWQTLRDGRQVPILTVGFRIPAAKNDGKLELLMGPYRRTISRRKEVEGATVVDPEQIDAETVEVEAHRSPFPMVIGFGLAVQFHERGWERLAAGVLAQSLLEIRSGGPSYFRTTGDWQSARERADYVPKAGADARAGIAGVAWNYWTGQLLEADTDWKPIHEMLRKILSAAPALAGGAQEAFMQSLEAAMVPSGAEPGTVEAMIDDLVNAGVRSGTCNPYDGTDPRYNRIELLGFEAVPALIEHLDDRRLTRSLTIGFNNFPSAQKTVRELASDLLQGLAGDALGRDWLQAKLGRTAGKTAVEAWWEKAQKQGEEHFAVENVLSHGQSPKIRLPLLKIAGARYPQYLGALYQRALQTQGDFNTAPFAEAIAGANLSKEEKIEILQPGLKSRDPSHRHQAKAALRTIDGELADKELVTQIRMLPEKTARPPWVSPEARVVYLVTETASGEVWAEFLQAAKRAEAGLRLELMRPFGYDYPGDRQRRQRLDFLAAFLDDEIVRESNWDPGDLEGPCAASNFPKIAVRDFAAMQIGSILRLRQEPEPGWPPEEWADFREKVKAALAEDIAQGARED